MHDMTAGNTEMLVVYLDVSFFTLAEVAEKFSFTRLRSGEKRHIQVPTRYHVVIFGSHIINHSLSVYSNAAAPPTISAISRVIPACLALLYANCNSLIISFALSVAFFIAIIRAACSQAIFSMTA